MKKLLKKSLLLLLPVLCLLGLAACKTPTGPVNYNVSGVINDIPTITSVVGEREFVGSSVTRHAKAEMGNLSVTCVYSGSPDPAEDVSLYCAELTKTAGFTQVTSFDTGKATLTAPSENEGQHITLTITPKNDDGYTIVTEMVKEDEDSQE